VLFAVAAGIVGAFAFVAAALGKDAGGEGDRRECADAEECPSDGFALLAIELVGAEESEAGASHDAGANEKSELGQG
jgi:hypothetical protein